ncbi:heterokaryon incompatibility protein-domain-containing protein [Xylogone sp. PMI_703]|nr:heterokaryon incompatibility protein-domain-containing protein [Xylogone sp. PMI_703]
MTSDSKAAKIFPERPPVLNTKSDAVIKIIRGWMDTCDAEHEECKKRSASAQLPRRLLALDKDILPDVKLRDTGSPEEPPRYVALGYCLGSSSEDRQVRTIKQVFQDHQNRIPLKTLPQSIQDAISVARGLGIPSPWVEALCIIQDDDDDDRNHEIENMGDIYSLAQITIAASNARGCGQGFLTTGRIDVFYNVNYSHKGESSFPVKFAGIGGCSLMLKPENEPLHTCGWTMQETTLSPRVVFFSSVQPYWRCQEDYWGAAGSPSVGLPE